MKTEEIIKPDRSRRWLIAFSLPPLIILAAHFLWGENGAQGDWKASTKLAGISVKDGEVLLKTEGNKARYKVFDIKTPPKVVVELYDTWVPTDLSHEIKPSGSDAGIDKVRVAQFSSSPEHVARVVVDLDKPLKYKYSSSDGAVSLRMASAAMPAMSPQARAASSASRKKSRDIMKDLPATPIDVNFQEADVQAVIAMLVGKLEALTKQKINLIMAQDVAGTLSLQLEDVPFKEVFPLVLNSKNLVATQTGDNILKIMGRGTYLVERQQNVMSTRIIPLNYANAAQIQTTLSNIRNQEGSRANILIAQELNALIITDTEEGFLQMEKLIKDLDVRPISVSIEAKIIDLKLDNTMDYGVEWQYAKSWDKTLGRDYDNRRIGSVNPNSATPIGGVNGVMPSGGTGEPGILSPGLPGFITSGISFGRVTNNSFLSFRIASGMKEGKVKLLSNPRIVTLNNQPATITVGTQIPIPRTTISQTGTTQDITYTNTGIILNVTPTVNPDRYVRMQITPTVSRPGTLAGGSSAPPIDTRTASTVIITHDGETVVIGGLIDETVDKQVSKVPLLGDIPILGWLFKRQSNVTVRTELLVFVTPTIVD